MKIPQLFFEVVWDTTKFNDKSLWPTDGSQPFVWSYGDPTGYGTHGDYVFGWKDDSLQKAMDNNCNINCPALKTQSIADGNKCTVKTTVPENIDDCKLHAWWLWNTSDIHCVIGLPALPGNVPITTS